MFWQVFFISSGNKSSDGGRYRGCLVLKGWGESAHFIFMLPCMFSIWKSVGAQENVPKYPSLSKTCFLGDFVLIISYLCFL